MAYDPTIDETPNAYARRIAHEKDGARRALEFTMQPLLGFVSGKEFRKMIERAVDALFSDETPTP